MRERRRAVLLRRKEVGLGLIRVYLWRVAESLFDTEIKTESKQKANRAESKQKAIKIQKENRNKENLNSRHCNRTTAPLH
jgi:hypothetical protein